MKEAWIWNIDNWSRRNWRTEIEMRTNSERKRKRRNDWKGDEIQSWEDQKRVRVASKRNWRLRERKRAIVKIGWEAMKEEWGIEEKGWRMGMNLKREIMRRKVKETGRRKTSKAKDRRGKTLKWKDERTSGEIQRRTLKTTCDWTWLVGERDNV